jgi:hypothetical protein
MTTGEFNAALFVNPPTAKTKAKLPLLKLAIFSGESTAAKCLRHDAAVTSVTGCELDYDEGSMTMEEAAARFRDAGVCALLYKTPGSTLEHPRWRGVFPFAQSYSGSTDAMKAYRAGAVTAAVEILGEPVANESYTLSQAFYFGVVEGKEWNCVDTLGKCIDEVYDIEVFINRPGSQGKSNRKVNSDDRLDVVAAIKEISTGAVFHTNLTRLAAHYVALGMKRAPVLSELTQFMNKSQDAGTERWDKRMNDLPRLVDSAIEKFSDAIPDEVFARYADAPDFKPDTAGKVVDFPIPEGLVGDIAQYVLDAAPVPNNPFAIMAGLLAVSVLSLNRYQVLPFDTRLNIYCAAVGVTGSGKDAPPAEVVRLLSAAGLGNVVTEGISSGVALQRALSTAPHKTMFYWQDEVWEIIQAAREGGQPYKRELTTSLMTLYGRAGGFFGGRKYADKKNNIKPIENPYVIFGGATTPARLMEALSDKHVADGFLNRLIVFQSAEDVDTRDEDDESTQKGIPDTLVAKVKTLAHAGRSRGALVDFADNPDVERNMVDVVRHPEAKEHMRVFKAKVKTMNGPLAALWSRAVENAIKVAGILAVGVDHQEPVITIDQAKWATTLVCNCLETFEIQLDQNLADSPFHARCNKAMDKIRNPSEYATNKRWGHLTAKGMPRGILIHAVRVNKRELNEVIEYLLESGQIKEFKVKNVTMYRAC